MAIYDPVDLLMIGSSHPENYEGTDRLNESTDLWLAGDQSTEEYLELFNEFGNLDYHLDRVFYLWKHLGIL